MLRVDGIRDGYVVIDTCERRCFPMIFEFQDAAKVFAACIERMPEDVVDTELAAVIESFLASASRAMDDSPDTEHWLPTRDTRKLLDRFLASPKCAALKQGVTA